MFNVTCLTTPTPVIGPMQQRGTKRTVHLQNQSGETIYLQFDGNMQDTGKTLSTSLGYKLAAGAEKVLSPSSPGGGDGSQPILALSASGAAVLHVQNIEYTKTVQ